MVISQFRVLAALALCALPMAAVAAKTDTSNEALAAQARALIPTVQAQQPARLRQFWIDHNTDRAVWKMQTTRYGDYLALVTTRLEPQELANGHPEETLIAVKLRDATTVTFIPGYEPNLNGFSNFTRAACLMREGPVKPVVDLDPTVAVLPNSTLGMTCGGLVEDGYEDRVGVHVEGIAQGAKDDQIVFGNGGVEIPEPPVPCQGDVCNIPPDIRSDGYTLRVPAGLGRAAYQQILNTLGRASS